MSPRRILVMQLARLGDLVQTWPLLRQLREVYPEAQIGLLMDESLVDLAKFGPRLDALYPMDLKKISRLTPNRPAEAYCELDHCLADLQAAGFDLVFNLNFSRLTLLIAYLLGAPVIGYQPVKGGREFWREPWLAWIYGLVHDRAFSRIHISDVFRHLVRGRETEAAHPSQTASSKEPVIALQLGTRHPRRTWPPENFARLAGLLIEKSGAKLRLLGTARERALGERVNDLLKPRFRDRVLNLQGKTDLTELAGHLREADLVVSGDTGPLHLAAALGTRVVAIFQGPASCFETGPYGSGQAVIQAEPRCHPCRESGDECQEPLCQRLVTPEFVAEVILAGFGAKGPGSGSRIPPEVRVYESFRDGFGVNYASCHGKPLGWIDLVGWAYRAAGARLLHHPSPRWPSRRPELSQNDLRALELLAKALQNGATEGNEPSVCKALTPLRAFGAALQHQAGWKEGRHSASERFREMKRALREELERFIS
uniref:Glycosyltransferase family 9 protein n=1 Tax=Desulfobacca acetoxidans TaxID=60893 RepID=A0A7C3SJC0_9BACT